MKGVTLVFHKEEDGSLFEKIITALKSRYVLVSLEELESLITEKRSTKNICHISFDDGEGSFYDTIFPLLKKHNLPASLFVSPGVISTGTNYWFQETLGYDEKILKGISSKYLNIPLQKLKKFSAGNILKCLPFHRIAEIIELYRQQTGSEKKAPANMTADQLRIVDASGLVTVGAHSLNHPILANENDDDCYQEISGSIRRLEILLGHPVKYFAYPNGREGIDFGEREKTYLRENRIPLAFSATLDNLSASCDPLSIPRMGFARMGLDPSSPLIALRLNLGKNWIDIKSIFKPSEKRIRQRIKKLLTS